MKMIIRTDASVAIGTGHVMRCLTLAEQLHRQGHEVMFICRELQGNLCDFISERGYRVHRLPYTRNDSDGIGEGLYAKWLAVTMNLEMQQVERILSTENERADWLIVDHYALDHTWHRAMRPYVGSIMVLDELANRRLDCNVLLDQNLYVENGARYDRLVPSECRVLTGPKHALLRSEFAIARRGITVREGQVKRLLVFFGGSDPSNETMKAIAAFSCLKNKNVECDVVVGACNPHVDEVRLACDSDDRLSFHCNVSNMAELMVGADLAIGAPGTTTWERCCLGLPSLLVAIAENQEPIGHGAHRVGIAKYLGVCERLSPGDLTREMDSLIEQPEMVARMSVRGMELVDGLGVGRVGDCLSLSVVKGTVS